MSNPTFQRRHYEAVAEILRVARHPSNSYADAAAAIDRIEREFSDLFRRDNHMFQSGKFADACQPGTSYRNRSR